ncbi:SIR2 family protein [Microbacterium aerolatum]|uniref:SIR2 family protein n=1 Tax=Microbacterium aerolatum TaxID=153731 RepID=UPI00384C7DB9
MSDSPTAPRTAVLLGAGASVDAGLPTTFTFARQLVEDITATLGRDRTIVKTLNFVYGAMVNHRTERGGDPFDAVNVETMISAIRLLRDRGTHEVAPFIQDWKPGVGRYASSSRGVQGAALIKALESDRRFSPGREVEAAVRAIIADSDAPSNGDLYDELERLIRTRARRLLLQHGDVSYLAPLIELGTTQPGGLDVATLNYDLTVEACARSLGVALSRGPERMGLGTAWEFDPGAAIRLHKIHGSIDLHAHDSVRSLTRKAYVVVDTSNDDFPPDIVIGDRDKLGSGGRTLALLVAFASALQKASKLVVVGYAFADPHVNDIILDWLHTDESRTLTVLDPSWPHSHSYREGIRAELTSELDDLTSPRIHVVRATTAEALHRALHEDPPAVPDPRLQVEVSWEGAVATVTFTNHGEAIEGFGVGPGGYSTPHPNALSIEREDAIPDRMVYRQQSVPVFAHGESLNVTVSWDNRPVEAALRTFGNEIARSHSGTWPIIEPESAPDTENVAGAQ